jgi:cytochrome c-type biogenesis protein CcmH
MKHVVIALLFISLGATTVFAASPEQPLTDPALEARAQSLAREIRCVVCENEPVALSSAEIAVDMRAAIRQRIKAGDSDQQVRRFFADRYGEFVLLRPRVRAETFALWGAPFILLLLGGGAILVMSRRPKLETALPVDDSQALAALASLDREKL